MTTEELDSIAFPLASGSAGALLIALAPMPFGFYQLLRLVVCGTACLGALRFYRADRPFVASVFVIIALLFNPIAKVAFDKGTWGILDLASAGLLAWFAYEIRSRTSSSR